MSSLLDPAGWLLIVGTFVLVLRWKVFAGEPFVRTIMVGAVLIRTLYSLVNVAVGPIFGLQLDAQAFQLEAVRFARGQGISVGLVTGWVYSGFLGSLYRITRGGLLLGQQLSVLAVVFSAATIIRIVHRMNVRPSRIKWVLAITLFLPAGIVYTSGTLREAFQQLLFLLTAEFALKTIDHPRVKTIALMSLTTALGASLHGALAIGGAAVAAGSLLFAGLVRSPAGTRESAILRRVLPIGLIVVVVVGLSVPTLLFRYNLGGGALTAATRFRNGTVPGRADYLRFRPGEVIKYGDLPAIVGLYELAPFPWQAQNIADVIASIEAIVRAALVMTLGIAVIHSMRGRYNDFLKVLLLAGGWLAIEFAWSLGTTNWGTGARHHTVGFPLLVIVAALAPDLVRHRGDEHALARSGRAIAYQGSPSLT